MVSWDRGETLAERFRAHAGRAQHLYGHVMRAMADDWESGGPVRVIFAGYEHAPRGSALPLRLLAGVFRLVLSDRAPELVRYYPCLGGEDPPVQALAGDAGCTGRALRRAPGSPRRATPDQ